MKPVLLLDVDGVLAPFGKSEGYTWIEELQDWWSDANIERLRTLRERFDLIWATAREHTANILLCPRLELDPLPFIEFGATRLGDRIYLPPGAHLSEFESWKLPWIIAWAKETSRPFAWIDDDIRPDAFKWAQEHDLPTLFVQVNPSLGLADAHVDELLYWADGLAHSYHKENDGAEPRP